MHADCWFVDFDANKVLDASPGVGVALINCTFDNNTIIANDHGAAVIQADAGGAENDTTVWLPVQSTGGLNLNSNSNSCMHVGVATGVHVQWQQPGHCARATSGR